MEAILFGEFFKRKRIALRKTLRQFSSENGFDPGNLSKLERGLLSPPASSDKLKQYARALKIREGSDEWYEFFDVARVSAGRIPKEIFSDKEVLSKLPLVFRTLKGQKLTKEQLTRLAKELKKV